MGSRTSSRILDSLSTSPLRALLRDWRGLTLEPTVRLDLVSHFRWPLHSHSPSFLGVVFQAKSLIKVFWLESMRLFMKGIRFRGSMVHARLVSRPLWIHFARVPPASVLNGTINSKLADNSWKAVLNQRCIRKSNSWRNELLHNSSAESVAYAQLNKHLGHHDWLPEKPDLWQ